MSVAPDDFLTEAQAALARTDEMGIRLAINRAYYGAFHLALTVSGLCPTPPPLPSGQKEGTHLALIRRFQAAPKRNFQGSVEARQIGALLWQFRDWRTDADYDLRKTLHGAVAQRAIRHATQVKALVAQLAALYNP